MGQCVLLDLYTFPGGTCAQWFSGSATALAVAVALGAHFYTAWRQSKADAREDAAEVAGISMLLRALLNDAEDNATMFHESCSSVTVGDKNYLVSRPLAAVRALQFKLLDKSQAEVLLRHQQAELAQSLDEVIGKANLNNLGIEDYAKIRSDASTTLEKYSGAKLNAGSEEEKIFTNCLRRISSSVEHFLGTTKYVLRRVIDVTKKFNEFCLSQSSFTSYIVETAKFAEALNALESGAKDESP